MFETVDTVKIATKLNKELIKIGRQNPLPVLVQVNTSGEASKSGVADSDVPSLVNFIRSDCPSLRFQGLMSMGALNDLEGFRSMARLRESLLSE